LASTSQDFTSGQVLTAAELDQLPQGVLATASTTSNLGPLLAGSETTLLTLSAVTPAQTSRRFRLGFHCRGVSGDVVNDVFVIRFKEGATTLNETHFVPRVGSSTITQGLDFSHYIDSPTVASHTYSVVVIKSSGTGNITLSGTSTAPTFLYLEDVGSA